MKCGQIVRYEAEYGHVVRVPGDGRVFVLFEDQHLNADAKMCQVTQLIEVDSITYKCQEHCDNEVEVRAWIAKYQDVPKCPLCGGYGEYESGYGPRGCGECNSRCVPYIGINGQRLSLDWDEVLIATPEGLRVFKHKDSK